jgi:3-keto-5-aminohexanoate cleavage enzyme
VSELASLRQTDTLFSTLSPMLGAGQRRVQQPVPSFLAFIRESGDRTERVRSEAEITVRPIRRLIGKGLSLMMQDKIIVAVAPVGANILPPSINPLAPEEVAADVVDCQRAGASMVHLHVRDEVGQPTGDLNVFARTLDLIRAASDIVIQGSTGGLSTLSLEERCVALNDPRVEVATLNMGSVNFGEDVYINRMPDIRFWADRMATRRVVPELEIFESGMWAAAQRLAHEGVIQPPYYVNLPLGAQWALPADPRCILFISSLLPVDMPWGVVHDGMPDLSLLATAIGMGASVVRVGFEDSVWYAPGRAAGANADLVTRIVDLIQAMGGTVATPEEARRLLGIIKMRRGLTV